MEKRGLMGVVLINMGVVPIDMGVVLINRVVFINNIHKLYNLSLD